MNLFGAVVGATSDSIKSIVNNIMERDFNFSTLQNEMFGLKEVRDRVKAQMSLSRNQLKDNEIARVVDWLNQVDELEARVDGLELPGNADGNRILHSVGRLPGKFMDSRRLPEYIKRATQLKEYAESIEKIVNFQHRLKPVEHIPGPSTTHQYTAAQNLAQLTNLLKDDSVTRIGVCGMGGVGKTTLVRNLNNQLASERTFSIIIWVTVSKDASLRRIQARIFERMKVEVNMEQSEESLASQVHEKLQKERSFLLILDDVWEALHLDAVGIPRPERCPGSKIIITSRFFNVCRQMNMQSILEVKVLNDEEAWELFSEKAGDVVMKEGIRPLAEKVAKECGGLPLAITLVGASMRGKFSTSLWNDALTSLQNAETTMDGVGDKVFQSIKWSYDSLDGKNHILCLLFCCLYPEDYEIGEKELVTYWFCEGLLDACLSYEESKNRGAAIIQRLKDSCLLEDARMPGCVKMHDIVRDVGMWIASSTEYDCRSLVRSGMELNCMSKDELSTCSYKRISFMRNKIVELPQCRVQCGEVRTLFLNQNENLEIIPASFFEGFEALKILDLSQTAIHYLPSLRNLSQLRALILRYCRNLIEFSSLDGLVGLLVLDCRCSSITRLPSILKDLSSLRVLDLSETKLEIIPYDSISRLSNLETLNISYDCRGANKYVEAQKLFDVLPNLNKLSELEVEVDNIPQLRDDKWFEQIEIFQIGIGGSSAFDTRTVAIYNRNLSKESIGWLLGRARSFYFYCCEGLIGMFRTVVSGSCFQCLKELEIVECVMKIEETTTPPPSHDLLPNLERILFYKVEALKSFSEFGNSLGLRFTNLKNIDISKCCRLKYIFSLEQNQSLEKLEHVWLRDLDELESFFGSDINNSLPKLEVFEVVRCDKMRKLPLSKNNTQLREIKCPRRMWNNLEWDDENTKNEMGNYFKEWEDTNYFKRAIRAP